MKKPNMTKIEQIEHFQTRVHRFSLLTPIGDFHHHHTLYIMYASRFKSPKKRFRQARDILGRGQKARTRSQVFPFAVACRAAQSGDEIVSR